MESRAGHPRARGRGRTRAAILAATLMIAVTSPAFAAIGDHIWDSDYRWGRTAAIDGSGNVTLYGVFFGTIDFGGGPLTAQNDLTGDIFLAHFDAQGAHQWSQQFTPQGGNGLFNFVIAADPAGNIYVSGRVTLGSFDFGGGPIVGTSTGEGALACFDAAGNHQWSFGFGTGEILDLSATGSKLVCVGELDEGIGVDFGGGPLFSAGQSDAFVVELSPSGAHGWSRSFGDSFDQASDAVAIDPSGNVVMAGSMLGSADFGGGSVTATGIEYFLTKLDSAGSFVWSRNLTGTVNSTGFVRHGLRLATGPSGDVVLGGGFRGDIDLGDGSQSAGGSSDIFVASYDENGLYRWGSVYVNTSANAAMSIDIDSGGNVLMTAFYNGGMDFGGGVLPSIGPSRNLAVVVFDTLGGHGFSAAYGTGTEIYGRFDRSNDIVLDGAANDADFGGGLISGATFLVKLDGTANTPAGANVPVVPVDETTGSAPVTMMFDDVSTAGETSLTTSTMGPPPPNGLSFGDMTTYYDISTTAGFAGDIEICIQYDEAALPGAESELALLHYDDSIPGWEDVTTMLDEATNTLCGAVSSLSPFALAVPTAPVGVPGDSPKHRSFALLGNAPNPFNPSTEIAYEVPEGGGHVTLGVYDAAGRLVRVLVRERQTAGAKTVRWGGRDRRGRPVSGGVYFYRMQAEGFEASRKMVLVE